VTQGLTNLPQGLALGPRGHIRLSLLPFSAWAAVLYVVSGLVIFGGVYITERAR
jgi:hypothetical protein